MKAAGVMCVALLGCGASGTDTPDAAPTDVTVHLFSLDGVPSVPTKVVIAGPSGAVQEIAGATGSTVTATIEDGSSVTAVMDVDDNLVFLDTTLEVNGGDEIELGYATADETVLGSFTVEWPLAQGIADSVSVHHPCGVMHMAANITRYTFEVKRWCKTDPLDILVTIPAFGTAPNRFIHTTVPFIPDGSVVLSEPFRDGPLFQSNVRNLGSLRPTSVGTVRYLPSSYEYGWGGGQPQPISTRATMITDLEGGDSTRLNHRIVDVIDGRAATYDLDVAAQVIAPPTKLSIDVNARMISASFDTTSRGDAMDLLLRYRYWPGPYVEWTIRGPIKTDVTFALPPVEERFLPLPKIPLAGQPCEYVNNGPCVLFVGVQESSEMDGYDDFKAHPTHVDAPFPIVYPLGARLRQAFRKIDF